MIQIQNLNKTEIEIETLFPSRGCFLHTRATHFPPASFLRCRPSPRPHRPFSSPATDRQRRAPTHLVVVARSAITPLSTPTVTILSKRTCLTMELPLYQAIVESHAAPRRPRHAEMPLLPSTPAASTVARHRSTSGQGPPCVPWLGPPTPGPLPSSSTIAATSLPLHHHATAPRTLSSLASSGALSSS